ncbi:response regulator transcription factor [Sphingomonas sp. SUN019]|uniref:response regulator n=1 Tax=Sphingomonas sp. SUN019 TaxID=2937788 RepID=UPI0021646127|nr:response regulator transcription factor [Sphingomonas sp. SUN019]UVO51289.1 response regulator transcription factor [Sphingomonas sp. SUN019]
MQRILIADDHPMFATALTMAAHSADPTILVDAAATLADAEATARAHSHDLILLDLMLPDVQGFAGLAMLRAMRPATPIAIVTSRDEPAIVHQAVKLGARGFLSKATPIEGMVGAIRVLLAGGQWLPDGAMADPVDSDPRAARIGELSVAQLKVLRAIASGRQNKQIAYDLGIAEPTVKSHLAAIFRKIGVSNRTQAVLLLKSFDPVPTDQPGSV